MALSNSPKILPLTKKNEFHNRATKYFHHVILILFNKTVINCIKRNKFKLIIWISEEKSKINLNIPLMYVKTKLKYQKKKNMKNWLVWSKKENKRIYKIRVRVLHQNVYVWLSFTPLNIFHILETHINEFIKWTGKMCVYEYVHYKLFELNEGRKLAWKLFIMFD